MATQFRIIDLDVARSRLSVRISEQHQVQLERICQMTGMPKTTAVESAITHMFRTLEKGDPIYHSTPPQKPETGHKTA